MSITTSSCILLGLDGYIGLPIYLADTDGYRLRISIGFLDIGYMHRLNLELDVLHVQRGSLCGLDVSS